MDFANGALSAAGTGKDVGAVLSPEQHQQMGGAEVYRQITYPNNDGLNFPMPPKAGDPPYNPFLGNGDKRSDAGTTDPGAPQTLLGGASPGQIPPDDGSLSDQDVAELSEDFAPRFAAMNADDAGVDAFA